MVIFADNQLGERYKFIACVKKRLNHGFQRFRCVFCTVMAENDRAIAQVLVIADCLNDGVYAVVFPVKAIHTRYGSKVRFEADKV